MDTTSLENYKFAVTCKNCNFTKNSTARALLEQSAEFFLLRNSDIRVISVLSSLRLSLLYWMWRVEEHWQIVSTTLLNIEGRMLSHKLVKICLRLFVIAHHVRLKHQFVQYLASKYYCTSHSLTFFKFNAVSTSDLARGIALTLAYDCSPFYSAPNPWECWGRTVIPIPTLEVSSKVCSQVNRESHLCNSSVNRIEHCYSIVLAG